MAALQELVVGLNLDDANESINQPLKISDHILGGKGTQGEWKWKTATVQKSVKSIEIFPDLSTPLKHATSSDRLLQIFGITTKHGNTDHVILKGNHDSYGELPIVHCDVAISSEDLVSIQDYSDAYQFSCEQRYGAAIIQFNFGDAIGATESTLKILGTRTAPRAWKEVSQIMLVDFGNEYERPSYLKEFRPGSVWTLNYDNDGSWTHPEFLFSDDVKLPWDKIMIKFVHHKCATDTKLCQDCIFYRVVVSARPGNVVLRGKDYSKSASGRDVGIKKVDLERLGLLSPEYKCTRRMSIYLFATRIPLEEREGFLKSFGHVFESQEDIEEIKIYFNLKIVT